MAASTGRSATIATGTIPRTRAERVELGRAARSSAPRSSHAEFHRNPSRPAPLDLLQAQDRTRLQALVPIRYQRMSSSPFAYFRGTALPMASDLANTPRTGFTVQACGDAHLMNFGVFSSPERNLVFDINDFDETVPGPWEWDVKRLAASIEVAGRANDFSTDQCRKIVLATMASYREAMRGFAKLSSLGVWYAHIDVEQVRALYGNQLKRSRRKELAERIAKASTRDNLGALRHFAKVVDGELRIAPDPPLVVPIEQLTKDRAEADHARAQMEKVIAVYRASLEPERRALLDRYQLVDLAHKVVGVGSVGTRCWIALLLGKDDQDPLFLQAKEAGPAVLEEFTGRSRYANAGRRVVVGQRLMQTVSDVLLGWVRVTGFDGRDRDFYIRQLRDGKGSAHVETMSPKDLRGYGKLCGWTLARAHARTGDEIAIAAYLGSGDVFDHAVAEFATAYANQNERDYSTLRQAIADGRVETSADQ